MRRLAIAAAACLLLACAPAPAEPAVDATRLAAVIDPIVAADMAETGAPGAGVVVVDRGRVVLIKGYGLADREAKRASDATTVWPIASITKAVTALAVMQQVERGRMRLDADVGSYLKTLRVPATYPQPITLADTLRHTSGLDELPGRRLDDPARIQPLGRFLDGRLVRHRAPGRYTSYSTYGVALAAVALEDVSGQPYEAYVRRHVFQPLGMGSARIMLRGADARGVAAPYELDDGKAARIAHEWYATPPTSSAAMSLEDMGRLLADLTADRPRLLPRATLDRMMAQQASLSPLVPGWGYGFQLDAANGRRIAEHGGDIGGFASLMSILPDERFAIFVVSHGEGSSLRFKLRKAVVDTLFPAPPLVLPPVVATDLAPYLGRYRASTQCHSCADPGNAPVFAVEANGKGGVSLWGSDWSPIGADAFVNPENGRRLVFVRGADGRVTALTGGSWRVGERIAD